MNPILIWLSGALIVGALIEYKEDDKLMAGLYALISIYMGVIGII